MHLKWFCLSSKTACLIRFVFCGCRNTFRQTIVNSWMVNLPHTFPNNVSFPTRITRKRMLTKPWEWNADLRYRWLIYVNELNADKQRGGGNVRTRSHQVRLKWGHTILYYTFVWEEKERLRDIFMHYLLTNICFSHYKWLRTHLQLTGSCLHCRNKTRAYKNGGIYQSLVCFKSLHSRPKSKLTSPKLWVFCPMQSLGYSPNLVQFFITTICCSPCRSCMLQTQ